MFPKNHTHIRHITDIITLPQRRKSQGRARVNLLLAEAALHIFL